MRRFLLPLFITLAASPSVADTFTTLDVEDGKAGFPCNQTMMSDAGRKFVLHLSDYEDVWHIEVFVDKVGTVLLPYFSSDTDMLDRDLVLERFSKIAVGGAHFNVDEVGSSIVNRKDVTDDSRSIRFTFNTRYKVANIADTMNLSSTLSIPGLADLDGAEEPLQRFGSCVREKLGLGEGEIEPYDPVAAYRNLFETHFEKWLGAGFTADSCGVIKFTDKDVENMISRAANAFLPGVMNTLKRRDFEKKWGFEISSAKLDGTIAVLKGQCGVSRTLFSGYDKFIERTIQDALDAE